MEEKRGGKILELPPETYQLVTRFQRDHENLGDTIFRIFSHYSEKLTRSPEKFKTKILLIGPPGSGKSSIRSVFFEEIDPEKIIYRSLEPTRGMENYVYKWFGVDVGIADSSGQEILDWFEEKREQAFNFSDAIIFVFDASRWDQDRDEILLYLYKTYLTKFLLEIDAEIFVFLHKRDLVPEIRRDHLFAQIKSTILQHLVANDLTVEEIDCRWTSIAGSGVFSLFRALRSILMKVLKTYITTIDQIIPSPTSFIKKKIKEITKVNEHSRK